MLKWNEIAIRLKMTLKPEWYYGELISIYEQAINNKKEVI